MKLLHGEHKVTLFRPLQPEMKIKSKTEIVDVLDKKVGIAGNSFVCTKTSIARRGKCLDELERRFSSCLL